MTRLIASASTRTSSRTFRPAYRTNTLPLAFRKMSSTSGSFMCPTISLPRSLRSRPNVVARAVGLRLTAVSFLQLFDLLLQSLHGPGPRRLAQDRRLMVQRDHRPRSPDVAVDPDRDPRQGLHHRLHRAQALGHHPQGVFLDGLAPRRRDHLGDQRAPPGLAPRRLPVQPLQVSWRERYRFLFLAFFPHRLFPQIKISWVVSAGASPSPGPGGGAPSRRWAVARSIAQALRSTTSLRGPMGST